MQHSNIILLCYIMESTVDSYEHHIHSNIYIYIYIHSTYHEYISIVPIVIDCDKVSEARGCLAGVATEVYYEAVHVSTLWMHRMTSAYH